MGDVDENLGTTMLFPGGFTQAGGLQQFSELASQDGRSRREVVVEEFLVGVVKESDRANDFVRDQQRRGQQGARFELSGDGKGG